MNDPIDGGHRTVLSPDVERLLRPDGTVVPDECAAWLELQLREQLRKARGNPNSAAISWLKALTISAERFEARNGSFSGTTGSPIGIIGSGDNSGAFLTCEQAAELTDRSERAIRKACQKGSLPARKYGNVWHIVPQDLDNYIHGGRPV